MALAVLLFLLAAAALIAGGNLRAWAGIACVAAAYLVRMAKGPAPTKVTEAPTAARPGRSMWAIGFALALLWIASYVSLREDALHGYHAAWPVYLFFVVVVVCSIFWGYLVAANI